MYKILKKSVLNQDTIFMRIENSIIPIHFEAGQFLICRVDEKSERIPLTIVEVTENSVDIIFQMIGFSTKKLGNLNEGDYILDIVGPLGKKSELPTNKRILCVCGGVGSAPLYPQVKKAISLGCSVDLIIGGRTKNHIFLEEEYQKLCANVWICTDDGSRGFNGNVLNYIKENIDCNNYEESIIIGPAIMMKLVVEFLENNGVQTHVSLNPIMIDGTGMCGECRVTICGKTFFSCIDGPDFLGKGIDFDELIQRQKNYKKQEEHICKVRGIINEK